MSLIGKMKAEFLFFAWEDLKSRALNYKHGKFCNSVRPPSKPWFLKTSYLILHGKILYSKFLCTGNSSISLKFLKSLIIQNSFFLILKPFFDEYIFLNASYISKYVCSLY